MNIWQIACGEPERDYRDVFLRHDVMLIGPGWPGPFDEKSYRRALKDEDEHVSFSRFSQVRSFKEKPMPGDLVLLRLGHHVIRIGVIPQSGDNGYAWSEDFDDILGWDVSHYRRVIWGTPRSAAPLMTRRGVFSNYKQQPTFTRVREARITRLAKHLARRVPRRRLKRLPPSETKKMSLEEFGVRLFQDGLANESIERAIDAIEKARRLGSWYDEQHLSGREPSEHEIIAHTTVPLMLALGWSEQLLVVEWKHIDLAFFDRTPTDAQHCVMICEAKRPHKSLESALEQAKDYVRVKQLAHCRKILLTSGTRLQTYRRRGNDWQLDGYANLEKLRMNHVRPKGVSASATLMNLAPARVG
jgi:hypothetical protein